MRAASSAGSGNGIFKSSDGGTTWRPLTVGLPSVIEANLAVAPSNPDLMYAMVAGTPQRAGGGRPAATVAPRASSASTSRSTPGSTGPRWTCPRGRSARPRPTWTRARWRASAAATCPRSPSIPKNENVVYSPTVVLWRSEDGGVHWSAVRGAYGGDDYQKMWINPNNPDILLVVSDQGAVISANRGESWSNWYTQPTAAMYHVTTDNAFPYRVCGGQQDSGSACVQSRSNDGMITFHDWHPVNIQEYGIAAPDPKDPDMVYGSSRTDVTLYNRKTGQSTNVGPDMGPRGGPFNRDVRTMPILWSPVDPDLLFYTSNVVWKTDDRGRTWTRISPDLSRQTWAVPASAGKYAAGVEPGPQGTITALSASPLDVGILWAGTDDGNIQVTMDGGAKWTNVTPPAIKPWTRIFNIEAGHFDRGTAYAAANTMRIDDMNPHFWRTHDGGKTWTEIDTGLAPGAVANSIREDPRQKGLLYAATETQVWVSFDDGDHWHSLRLDMPAVSVRDIQVKDDDTCLCSDLVAGTHGRGFWILDDVTPLRQAAKAAAATEAYLFEPATAVRVRYGMNDPTEWPPELPHGENPPPGGIIDYYLAADATGAVHAGRPRRRREGDPVLLERRPGAEARSRARPGGLRQGLPAGPDGAGLPRAAVLAGAADGRLDPQGACTASAGICASSRSGPSRALRAARPGRCRGTRFRRPMTPWAPPGRYTVRLTVNGQAYTQPLTLRLDPRVTTPAADLARLAELSREMYDGSVTAHAAYEQARALVDGARRRRRPGRRGVQGRGRGRGAGAAPARRSASSGDGAPSGPPTLNGASDAMMAAAMAMQEAEVAPTARQVAACDAAGAQSKEVMGEVAAAATTGLAALNAKRTAAGLAAIKIQ